MKRIPPAMACRRDLALPSAAFASRVMAATTIPLSLFFSEPIVPDVHHGCSADPNGNRGSGQSFRLLMSSKQSCLASSLWQEFLSENS